MATTTREEVVKRFSEIPGVGAKKAEHLYDAGFTSMEKLARATKEDLMEVEGVGPKLAEAILKGLAEIEAPAEEQKIEVVEEKKVEERKPKAKKAKEEVVEEAKERPYRVRAKAQLSDELRTALHTREELRRHTPAFKRDQWYRYKKIDPSVWRKPMGISNKQLKQYRYRGRMPRAGYGGPAAARGLHPSGFAEVIVHNSNDLETIDPKTQAARIAGAVGGRKRESIEKVAAEKGIRVLNPRSGA